MIACVSYLVNASECAQAMQSYMQAIGLNVNVSVLEAGSYQEMQEAGDYDINFTDLSGSVSQNLKFVYEIFGTDHFNTGYQEMYGTDLLDLTEKMDATMDDAEQEELRSELYGLMAERYSPYVLLWSDVTIDATTSDVKDVHWVPVITGQYYYSATKE